MAEYGHLNGQMSPRGFKYMPAIPGRRDRGAASVYEASHAEAPCIWLKVEDDGEGATTVALEAEKAFALAEQILYLVRNHYQGFECDPEWAAYEHRWLLPDTWPEVEGQEGNG